VLDLISINEGKNPQYTNAPSAAAFPVYDPILLNPSTSANEYAMYVSALALTATFVPTENTLDVGLVEFQ